MKVLVRCSLGLIVLAAAGARLVGQVPPMGQLPQPRAEMPPINFVAATVNGQPVAELAVYRAVPADERKNYDLHRKDILQHLIENSLIDQYLLYLKIDVGAKELDEKMNIIKMEAEKKGGLDKVLKANFVTEDELRRELASLLRWDRFVVAQSTEEALRDFFNKNKAIFDGSQVHARHILLKPDARLTSEQAVARLTQLKKWMDEETQRELSKLPVEARTEKRSAEVLEKIFAEVAGKESTCPSKENGGDLRWFQRDGMMVEAFAKTAFALKTFQISDVVTTKFGHHLILTIDRKPGKDVKFDDIQVKVLVREVYSDRLREAVVASMRRSAKIVINAPPAK